MTCWPSDFAGDEAEELVMAYQKAVELDVPSSWRPDVQVADRPRDWAAFVGMLEVARMRAVGYRAELAKVVEHRDLLIRLAVESSEARAIIQREMPEIAAAAALRKVHVR